MQCIACGQCGAPSLRLSIGDLIEKKTNTIKKMIFFLSVTCSCVVIGKVCLVKKFSRPRQMYEVWE